MFELSHVVAHINFAKIIWINTVLQRMEVYMYNTNNYVTYVTLISWS